MIRNHWATDGGLNTPSDLIGEAKRHADALAQTLGRTAPPSSSFPGYQIIREIHRGGQGTVYFGIQQGTSRKVAIKVLHLAPFGQPSARARFEREIRILGTLHHPHIVAIHDSGVAPTGEMYFVMDYVSGQPLDVHMASPRRSVNETLRLFAKICEAVNAAHLRGIIHRDLKPSNIRIDAADEPHILDFGLAKVSLPPGADEDPARVRTLTGQFVGTLPWASPEQAGGSIDQLDMRTDVYSLGVILYQMLTGRFPYDVGGAMRDVLENILVTPPIRPRTLRREINDEIETILLKCLAKDRERRYETAGVLAADVHRYFRGEPIHAKRDSVVYVARKALARHKVRATAAVLLIALTAALSAAIHRSVQYQALLEDTEGLTTQALEIVDRLEGVEEDPALEKVAVGLADVLVLLAQTNAADFPEFEASLRQKAGDLYLRLNDFAAADRHLERAYVLRERLHGARSAEAAETLRSQGANAYRAGDLPRAKDCFARAASIREALFTAPHEALAESLNDRAAVAEKFGEFAEAESLHRRALRMREQLGDPAAVALSRNNLASFLRNRKRFDEALEQYDEAVHLLEASPNRETEIARILGSKARTLLDARRCDLAGGALQEAMERKRWCLPGKDFSIAHTEQDFARYYLDCEGNPVRAEEHGRTALAIRLNGLAGKPNHPRIAESKLLLAECLIAQGKLVESRDHLLAVCDMSAAYQGADWNHREKALRLLETIGALGGGVRSDDLARCR